MSDIPLALQTKPYLSMSLEELQAELIKWQDTYKLADLNQYTLKILMNSSYGSLSLLTNPFSAYGVLGSSITSTGRFYNRYVAYRINVFINSILNKYSEEDLFDCPYTIQSDTDTVSGDSILYFTDKKITIKNFFDTCEFEIEEHLSNGKHIKHINKKYNCLSLSSNYEKQFKDVKYVMAHKVEKKYYKIRVRSDEVVVTEDHGLIVSRDGKVTEVRPYQVKNTDKFIRLKSEMFTDNILNEKCKRDLSTINLSEYGLVDTISYDNIRSNFKITDERRQLINRNIYYYSHKGLIAKIYQHIIANSKDRNMSFNISKVEFIKWLVNNNFVGLYQKYWDSHFNPFLIPSINRLDDLRPYTYNNMELNTFEHNIKYQKTTDYRGYWKSFTPVGQVDTNGNVIEVYNSTRLAASKMLNVSVEAVTKNELHRITNTITIDNRINKFCSSEAYNYKWVKIDNDLDFVSSDDFEIIDLGICNETVYDIEVEDNHNFFANNICVHNSSYNLLEGLCDKYLPHGNITERLEFAQKFYEEQILPVIEAAINEVSYTLNVYNPKVMKMDQEVLASSFISVAPKRYYLRNHFKEIEGKVVLSSIEKAKIKITGLSVVGKSTPGWSKKHLKPVMNLILDDTEKNVSKYINDCKDSIYSAELISVCTFKKVSKVSFDDFYNNKFYRYSDNNNLTTVGGHGKGALWYNKYMFEKQLTHLYPLIQPGDTVKVLPLLKDNPLVQSDTIAFIDMKFITEQGFYKYIDYEVLFEKIFIKNVEIILKPLGWEVFNTYEDLESLWGDIDL